MSMCKTERNEPIYEGSRSLYTRSPPLTRANLNRSQSVYSKNGPVQCIQPREHTRPGAPLFPAQSLYPMATSNSNAVNQNHQNQQRQGAENIYGTKLSSRDIYGKIPGRHEYIYGGVKKQDSSDNTYNSYVSSSSGGGNSKIPPSHVTRKDNYQNVSKSPENHNSYYHNQPSPSSQY